MADEEAPVHVPSIRERMAALNLNQVARTPTSPPPTYDQAIAPKRAKPPPPPLPKRPTAHRAESVNNPPLVSNGIASLHTIGNEPAAGYANGAKKLIPPPTLARNGDTAEQRPSLPPRRPTGDKAGPPSLPPRRPSGTPSRRGSQESLSSVVSSRSSISGLTSPRSSISTAPSTNGQPNGSKFRVRAPEYDPASLPPLPERKSKEPKEEERSQTKLRPMISAPVGIPRLNRRPTEADDEQRPALPTRPTLPSRQNTKTNGTAHGLGITNGVGLPKRSALDFAMNKSTETPPPLPTGRSTSSSPPPIPLSSRPNLATLQASKPKPGANGAASACCLKCRDFSAPDNHAARFPRQSLPSTDINWVAQNLTSPFTSETDKARALFTWLHHNIAYDTEKFFSGKLTPSTPASTISTGLAVCEGYAGLFAALAAAAGLEAVVVCGHGKGYGYDPNNLPVKPDGHAWSAVRIDGGEWKLIDCCWGAGHIECEKKNPAKPYIKAFHPDMFTMDNLEFGERHYPEDQRYFFRPDGRCPTFKEYFAPDLGGQKRQVFSNATPDHGIAERSVKPELMNIPTNGQAAAGPTIRFQFEYICRHWDPVKHGKGKPYLFVLKINGRGGNSEEYVPLQTDGYFHWCDVPREKLGVPGQPVMLYFQSTYLDGRDARGLTYEEYHRTRPQWRSWGWGGIAMWQLV